MGFFSRRRNKESALPDAPDEQALGAFANPEGQPTVGEQVGGGMPAGFNAGSFTGADAAGLMAQIGPAIQQAIASGNVQITQGQPQVIDMRGSGLREQIMGIMQQHGIDATGAGASGQQINASAYGNMQQQILEALHQHGLSPNPAQANPADYAQMQQELMAVLAKHGINTGGALSAGETPQIPPAGEGGTAT